MTADKLESNEEQRSNELGFMLNEHEWKIKHPCSVDEYARIHLHANKYYELVPYHVTAIQWDGSKTLADVFQELGQHEEYEGNLRMNEQGELVEWRRYERKFKGPKGQKGYWHVIPIGSWIVTDHDYGPRIYLDEDFSQVFQPRW